MTTPKKTRNAPHVIWPPEAQPAANATKKSRCSATEQNVKLAVRPATKLAALTGLLERPKGATLAQMCAKTGWQAHSVRAALTGLRKRGLGISRGTNNAGSTVYSIASQRNGPSS